MRPPAGHDDLELPPGLCRYCGFSGPHRTRLACIDPLRDEIATLTLFGGGAKPATIKASRFSGFHRRAPSEATPKPAPEDDGPPEFPVAFCYGSGATLHRGILRTVEDDSQRARYVEAILARADS